MSLEYAIDYGCGMHVRHGAAELRSLARLGSLVSRIVEASLESPGSPSEESIRFTSEHAGEIERLENIAAYCRSECPVVDELREDFGGVAGWDSLHREEMLGCAGRIRYPIEARFERFLADRVQLLLDTAPSSKWPALLRLLLAVDSPFDGEISKELRRITTDDGLRFFESRLPIPLLREAARLTSDHIFDLLGGFSAEDEAQAGYAREIPPAALGDYIEFLEAVLLWEIGETELSRLCSTSRTFAQYLRFLQTMRAAHRLGVRILLE